jgi:hypothetical protein
MRAQQASSLDSVWACLDCYWKGRAGEMALPKRMAGGFVCPKCKSDNTHPAWREVVTVNEYFGPIGTRN